MKTFVTEKFTFEAAHRLKGLKKENEQIHGHSFEVHVTISGEPNKAFGWLIPQDELREKVAPFIKQLDHKYLNEIMELTTAEMIARHIFLRLMDKKLPDHIGLESVKVFKVGMVAEVRG